MSQELIVALIRTIAAPVEKVFDAWLEPTLMAKFMRPAPGVQVRDVSVEPRVGGKFSLVMDMGQTQLPVSGEYLEIERPHRLVFRWLSSQTTSASVVELVLSSTAEGGTELQLRHTGFPDQERRDNHASGWGRIVGELETSAASSVRC